MIKSSLRDRFALARNVVCALLLGGGASEGRRRKIDPEADRKALQAFFFAKFPKVAKEDFGNGPYAVNAEMRKQWKEIMQFPPYEMALDEGHAEWEKPFANGKHYADCFDNKGEGIRQTYPRFIAETGQVETLEGAINRCRVENGEKPLDPMTGLMASLAAVMSESSRGKPFAIAIPDDPRALAAYERGKEFFYSRKGQLGVSCASCHMSPAGERMRGDILAPALGILGGDADLPLRLGQYGHLDSSHLHLLVADPRGAAEVRRRGLSQCRIFPLLHEQRHSHRRSGDSSMIRAIFLAAGLAILSLPALAATQAEAEAALAAAQAAETEAVAAKAAWTSTEAALTQAKKALAAGKWDEAKAAADEALTLAKLSVEQANEQKTSWRNAVFR